VIDRGVLPFEVTRTFTTLEIFVAGIGGADVFPLLCQLSYGDLRHRRDSNPQPMVPMESVPSPRHKIEKSFALPSKFGSTFAHTPLVLLS